MQNYLENKKEKEKKRERNKKKHIQGTIIIIFFTSHTLVCLNNYYYFDLYKNLILKLFFSSDTLTRTHESHNASKNIFEFRKTYRKLFQAQ